MKTYENSRRARLMKGLMTGMAAIGLFALTASEADAQSEKAAKRAAADSAFCHKKKLILMRGHIPTPIGTAFIFQPPRVTATDSAFARRAEAELDSLVKAGKAVDLPRVRIVSCKIPLYDYVAGWDNRGLDEKERSDPWGEKAKASVGDDKPGDGKPLGQDSKKPSK